MAARTFKILLVIFLALLVAIPVGFYIIRQLFLKPQQTSTPPKVAEEVIIINSPPDLEVAIKKVSPQFANPETSSKLLKLLNEAENNQAIASLSAQLSAKINEARLNINITDIVKSSKYFDIFNELRGYYYGTASPQILSLIRALERFYQINFPKYYRAEDWTIETRTR